MQGTSPSNQDARDSITVGGTYMDWSRYPVILVRPPPRSVTNEELKAFLDTIVQTVTGKAAPFATVIDLREAGHLQPAQRRMLTDMMNGSGDDLNRVAATALIFNSAIMRGFLTAMLWMFKPPYPVKVFDEVGEATRWAQEQITLWKARNSATNARTG